MAKALDNRMVDRARPGDIKLTLNLKIANPDPEVETPLWFQMATIDYELLDATGAVLRMQPLTHQTAGVAVKPSLGQAYSAVGAELMAWIRADRLALADNDS